MFKPKLPPRLPGETTWKKDRLVPVARFTNRRVSIPSGKELAVIAVVVTDPIEGRDFSTRNEDRREKWSVHVYRVTVPPREAWSCETGGTVVKVLPGSWSDEQAQHFLQEFAANLVREGVGEAI